MTTNHPPSGRPRVGISACLLGEEVRYDGGHKRDAVILDALESLVEWVPVCPEVEAGFGTPREPMNLVRTEGGVRVITVDTARDVTEVLDAFAKKRVSELAFDDLSGYVFKKDSPSCGLDDVKVYDADGVAERSGRGRFAAALIDRFPNLPVEDESRLSDPRLRQRFLERVLAYSRQKRG